MRLPATEIDGERQTEVGFTKLKLANSADLISFMLAVMLLLASRRIEDGRFKLFTFENFSLNRLVGRRMTTFSPFKSLMSLTVKDLGMVPVDWYSGLRVFDDSKALMIVLLAIAVDGELRLKLENA